MTITTHSPQETIDFAEKVGKKLKPNDVIAYKGGMGAGKTTFTIGLAKGMGLNSWVSSPTFALVYEYEGEIPLCHFDMYRINTQDELYSTGFFDYLDTGRVLAIEWSENIELALPEGYITIDITINEDDSRTITVLGDERFENIGN